MKRSSSPPRNRKSSSPPRSPSRKSPKSGEKIGRFSVKSVKNINNEVSSELKKITRDAKLEYLFNIDFTEEKEFQDVLKSNNISNTKLKLNKYINLVEKSIDIRNNYLKKLLKLKANLNNVVYLPQKYPRKSPKKPLNILSPLSETPPPIIRKRQSSYEEVPYYENGKEIFRHKTNPNKQKIYVRGKMFEIEDETN
jgi:hypothetical protein